MACIRKELVMSMWVAQFRLSISPILSIFLKSFLDDFVCAEWRQCSMNPWISSGLATMVEFWDAGMCCWPVWDHIWIVWFFGRVFFFLWPGNFNQLVVFWQVNASGKGVVCDFNSVVLQYHPASMESIDHRLTDATKKIIEASQQVGSRGWLYGQDLELWCDSKWDLKAVGFFHDFVDGKLGNSNNKRCAPTPVEWALLTPKQVQLTRQWCAK